MTASPAALALADAALRVARKRAAVLDRMKVAVLAEDSAEVMRLARMLVGIDECEEREG